MPAIDFWFEFASTYSYPAAMRVEKLARKKGLKVNWKPFLLGPVFKAQGMTDSPFNLFPVKGAYMWRDMERICKRLKIPFSKPQTFPQNGLLAARLCLSPALEDQVPEFARKVYQAQFAKGLDISNAETLAPILSRLGINSETAFDQAQSDEVKNQLRDNTSKAMELQIFGAPTLVTPDGELFWGNDRLKQAVAWAAQ